MPDRSQTSDRVLARFRDVTSCARRRRRTSDWHALFAAVFAFSCGDATAAGYTESTIEITPPALSILVGTVVPVTALVRDASGTPIGGADVFWSTEQPQVASVSAAGIVTAVSSGKTLMAASWNGASAVIPVSVSPLPVTLVRIQPASVDIAIGARVTLIAEPLDATGSIVSGLLVTWSSANTSIATIDDRGTVTAVAPGTAALSAAVAGQTGYAVVTVRRAPIKTSH